MDPSNLHIPNTTVTAQSNDNLDKEMREKALEMLRAINGLNTQHIAATTDPVHAEALKATLPKLDNLTFKFLSTFTSPEAAVFAMSTAQASEYSDLMDYISSAPDLPLPAVVDLSTTSLMATTSSISPGATVISLDSPADSGSSTPNHPVFDSLASSATTSFSTYPFATRDSSALTLTASSSTPPLPAATMVSVSSTASRFSSPLPMTDSASAPSAVCEFSSTPFAAIDSSASPTTSKFSPSLFDTDVASGPSTDYCFSSSLPPSPRAAITTSASSMESRFSPFLPMADNALASSTASRFSSPPPSAPVASSTPRRPRFFSLFPTTSMASTPFAAQGFSSPLPPVTITSSVSSTASRVSSFTFPPASNASTVFPAASHQNPPMGAFSTSKTVAPSSRSPASLKLNTADNDVLSKLARHRSLKVLKLCYWSRSKGELLSQCIAREYPNLKSLELDGHSRDWVLAIINAMPQSVHQPVLRFSQLDLPVSTTLLTRKEILSDLIVDFRTTTAGERTLQYLLLILMECTGSQYLEYHAHTDEAKFDKALLKASWNLPRLAKLRAFGLFRNSIFPKDQLIGFLPNWKFKKIQRRYECCANLVRHEFGAVDYRLMQHVQTLPSLKSVMVDCTEFTRP